MLFLTFLLASSAAGATGMIFKPGTWYDGLRKPGFTPPKWVFPLAWISIYILSAWAAARLAPMPGTAMLMALWAAQIALNTLWTPVFFGARRMGAGMAIISILWLVVMALTIGAFRTDLWSGVMLLPYALWLCVAAALNWRIWRDNPGAATT